MPSRAAQAYIAALCLVAGPLSVVALFQTDRLGDLLCFMALFFVIERLKTPPLVRNVTFSLSGVVATATYPVLGLWGAPVFLSALLVRRPGQSIHRRLYNVAQNALCTFCGALVYLGLGGTVGINADSFPYILIPITAANLTYHAVNLLLFAGVLWLDTRINLVRALRSTFMETVFDSLGHPYLGLLMAVLWLGDLGPLAGVLMLVPLLMARWAQFRWVAEQAAHQSTLRALAQAIETKDVYTRGHGERVSKGARMLGTEIGWEGDRLDAIAEAGLLHDVGKIGVSTRVLQKDGRLTEEEYEAIKAHPMHGVTLVGDIAFLEDARTGIMHHHERYDGRGYPSGLEGEDIPIFARVLAIADAFDCMTSVRSYREARPTEEAMAELIRCKGDQFDPALVDLFVAAVRTYGWQAAPAEGAPWPKPVSSAYDHDDPMRPPQVEDKEVS